MKWRALIYLSIIVFSISGLRASAQIIEQIEQVKLDTNYVQAYKDELTARIYVSRKQNGYNLSDRLSSPLLKYRTNDNLLIGMGYTYNFLTLNLAVKMPFINQDDHVYGESKYLDLNIHTIFRSYIVDFYLQWSSGYFLSNPEKVVSDWGPNSHLSHTRRSPNSSPWIKCAIPLQLLPLFLQSLLSSE